MKILQYLGPVALAAGLIAVSGDAGAIDPSVRRAEVAGSVCQKVGTIGTPAYSLFGTISNEHTSQILQLDCPLPFIVDTSYGDRLDVTGWVTGNGGSVSCTIYVEKMSPTPSSPTFYSTAFSTSTSGNQLLSGTVNVFENASYGVMHAACNLPPKTGGVAAAIRGFTTKD